MGRQERLALAEDLAEVLTESYRLRGAVITGIELSQNGFPQIGNLVLAEKGTPQWTVSPKQEEAILEQEISWLRLSRPSLVKRRLPL